MLGSYICLVAVRQHLAPGTYLRKTVAFEGRRPASRAVGGPGVYSPLGTDAISYTVLSSGGWSVARPPWFPLYPRDYDADTADLSLEQDGLYSRMLRRAWYTSPDGCSLPADEILLARVLAIPLATLRRQSFLIARYFVRDGVRLISKRLSIESTKAAHVSEVNAVKGRKGVEAKRSRSLTPAQPQLNPKLNPSLSDSQSQESKEHLSASHPASVDRASPVPPDEREISLRDEQGNGNSPPHPTAAQQLAALAAHVAEVKP